MSLLPMQILPETTSLGSVNEDGTITINHNWWLLIYNVVQSSIGSGFIPGGDPVAIVDSDVVDNDAMINSQGIANAMALAVADSNNVPTSADLPDIGRALLWSQDDLLPDPIPQAQPAQSITVGVSPFVYTAPFSGSVAITGGTVSNISIIRQGVTIATGMIAGLIPISRTDQVQVTYTGAPIMNFLPT